MSLKKSHGNMYVWVSHMHAALGGECPHKCAYCYVANPRFGRPERFCGPIRILEDEMSVRFGEGKTIFIEHCNDLFCEDVPDEFIHRILEHCAAWPKNTYVLQTKNPARYFKFMDRIPKGSILGTTIETNREIPNIGNAPAPWERYVAMKALAETPSVWKKFLTVEPILDFDVEILGKWIGEISPDFLNIGADSKGHNLPEPTMTKIHALVDELKKYGIEVREKHNMQRLIDAEKKKSDGVSEATP